MKQEPEALAVAAPLASLTVEGPDDVLAAAIERPRPRADEGPRRGTTLEKMAELKTLPGADRLTAGVASQISDASAALLIASEAAVKEHGLKPRARIHHLSVRGADPIWMLTAPIPATQHALKKTGMKLSDIDLVEINEAFASVVMAWAKDLEAVTVHAP